MQVTGKWILAAMCVLAAPVSAFAEIYTQLDTPFVPFSFNGFEGAQSHYDTGPLAAGEMPNFATSYDNLTFNSSGFITNFSWVGIYDISDPANAGSLNRTNSFDIGIYANAANAPGALLQLYSAQPAVESATPDPEFFQYTTAVNPFAVTAGTQYWVSIAGRMPYGTNGFNWAFSGLGGDNRSFNDFQSGNQAPVRSLDAVDYSFSAITAVPEPSSCLLLAGALGTIGLRKWRARRRVAA